MYLGKECGRGVVPTRHRGNVARPLRIPMVYIMGIAIHVAVLGIEGECRR